jgi:hypothetical protein
LAVGKNWKARLTIGSIIEKQQKQKRSVDNWQLAKNGKHS